MFKPKLQAYTLLQAARSQEPGGAGSGEPGGGGGEGGEKRQFRMSTCILINPDADLKRFHHTDYAHLRGVCDHITMYGDHADFALWYSETFNRWQALGKHPFQMYQVRPVADGGVPDTPSAASASGSPAQTTPAAISVPAEPPGSRFVQGEAPPAPAGMRNKPLDMDVIDVSWMDANMHDMRHNFFNINKWMVDDLREILTTRNRAKLRSSRMTHRFNNVYSFLAVPAFVVNP